LSVEKKNNVPTLGAKKKYHRNTITSLSLSPGKSTTKREKTWSGPEPEQTRRRFECGRRTNRTDRRTGAKQKGEKLI